MRSLRAPSLTLPAATCVAVHRLLPAALLQYVRELLAACPPCVAPNIDRLGKPRGYSTDARAACDSCPWASSTAPPMRHNSARHGGTAARGTTHNSRMTVPYAGQGATGSDAATTATLLQRALELLAAVAAGGGRPVVKVLYRHGVLGVLEAVSRSVRKGSAQQVLGAVERVYAELARHSQVRAKGLGRVIVTPPLLLGVIALAGWPSCVTGSRSDMLISGVWLCFLTRQQQFCIRYAPVGPHCHGMPECTASIKIKRLRHT